MVSRVALASCSLWPTGRGDHAGLAEALSERGVRADWVPWDEPGTDWASYDLVLLRETWDYPTKLAAFLGWVDWLSTVTVVVNPPAAVRWNHHKRYLLALAAAGVATVPTILVRPDSPQPEAALRAAGAGTVVVKPAVGIGGDDAERGGADDPATAQHLRALLANGDALVQPYLRSIETAGETSLVLFGGRLSHCVAKRPTGGEFRITIIGAGFTRRLMRRSRRPSWPRPPGRRLARSPAQGSSTREWISSSGTMAARSSWRWS